MGKVDGTTIADVGIDVINEASESDRAAAEDYEMEAAFKEGILLLVQGSGAVCEQDKSRI